MDDAWAKAAGALSREPGQPPTAYLQLARQLYQLQRYAEGERLAAEGLARHPQAHELWNIRGVFLRMLRRRPEALAALDQAIALSPGEVGPRINRGNLLLDMGEGAGAATAFAELVAEAPGEALLHHHLGRAFGATGRPEAAAESFRKALAIRPERLETWRELAGLTDTWRGAAEAEAVLQEALAANPDAPELLEAKAVLLRTSGQRDRTEAYLLDLATRHPDMGWVQFHLGDLVVGEDRARGQAHLRRALALEPDNLDHIVAMAQGLEWGAGADLAAEAAEIEEAYSLTARALALGADAPGHTKVLRNALGRVSDVEALEAFGDFGTLGRDWARAGFHTALLRHMAQVRSYGDRLELLEQHRIWGRAVEARAASAPIARRARGPRTRIRLGVMSSDLRNHVVARFAQPIFEHIDARFEVYAYSFFKGREDAVQARIASQVTAFRWRPELTNQSAAQMIGDDDLDVLVELGGSTQMNRLEVMAYRPAPLQASWLGYPHSSGLSTIDRLICDPFNAPVDPSLLIERPLMMPSTWIALGSAFSEGETIAETSAEDRRGVVTFGTANNPYKYTRPVLRTWAAIVARVPGARFAFIRPEAGAPSFRRNVLAEFAAEGVGEDRVDFHAVRGEHLAFYNQVDITLDTFPLTGGTTTVDSLWMGAPVVSLVGEGFFERLSYSILSSTGLQDLCARDTSGYVEAALALAGDRARRRHLRATLRQRMGEGPLGQAEIFARDFYDAIAQAVEGGS